MAKPKSTRRKQPHSHVLSEKDVARFWASVDKSGDGCWPWKRCTKPRGYGVFKVAVSPTEKVLFRAHRLSWELANGRPIPEGLTIDHLCRNRACVNPAHLEPVTVRENTLRGEGKTARQARQTHCKHGHPYDAEHLWVDKKTGWRSCRLCRSTNQALKRAKLKSAQ